MKGETVTTQTGFRVDMTADEARGLYASLYRLSGHIGVSSTASRSKYPWADSLFELYDLLYEGGFSE